ncbi:RHS repeat-associated core domain-containing protein [Streptomyces werraensis]|uniref:RHS repeat-associated core domain-containing protein n=1 Tax=Streptomyces werraensis TaxID=68284 RepID=UPI001CE2833D
MRSGLLARSRLLVVGALALALVGGTVSAQAAPPQQIPAEVAAGIPQEPPRPEREKKMSRKQDKPNGPAAAEVDGEPVTDDAVYAYDAAGRLVGVSDLDGETARYRYDEAGNRLGVDRYASSELSVLSVVPLRALPGARITISGTGFSTTAASNTVTFGSVAATVVSATATKLVVQVPAGAANGRITVKVGTRFVLSGESFTLAQTPAISSVAPASAPPGASVVLTGSGFEPELTDNQVRFNGILAEVTSRSATSLSVRVPPAATTGPIELITPDGQASGPSFTVLPPVPEVESSAVTSYTDSDPPLVWSTVPRNYAQVEFDGVKGDNVGFGFTGFTYQHGVDVELLGPDGAVVPGATGTVNASVTRWGVRNLPADGRYTLRLKPGITYNPGETYVTVSKAVVLPELSTTAPTSTANITRVGQEIATSFTATAGADYNLAITGNTLTASSLVTVIAPSGAVVGSGSGTSVNAATESVLRMADLPATGTYKVFIRPNMAVTGSVSVTLSADKVVPLSVDAAASPVVVTRPGERVRLTFTAPASGEVGFAVTGNTFTEDNDLYLVDSSGGTGTFLKKAPRGAGAVTYLADLQPGQPYALTVTPVKPVAGELTPWLSSPVVVALSADTARTGLITRPGQQLDLQVGGTAGSGGSIVFNGATFGTSKLTVKAPTGDTHNSGTQPLLRDADLDLRAPMVTGTYKVRISPDGPNTGQVGVVYRPDAVGGNMAVGGPKLTGTIAYPGQNSRFTFDGTAGQRLTLDIANSPYTWQLSVRSPDGTWLLNQAYVADAATTYTLPALKASGQQIITAAPQSLRTGAFTLGLSSTPAAVLKADKPAAKKAKAAPEETRPAPRGAEPVGADVWRPDAANLKGIDWFTRKGKQPKAPEPLRAPKGQTAINGYVLKLDGKPLADVTVRAGEHETRTDARGRFLLRGIGTDTRSITVDGTTANTVKRTYGRYDIHVEVKAGKTTGLGFPVWMSPLDMAHTVRFTAPAAQEVVLRTPRIPGLEVRLPKGSVVRDERGRPVTELGITAIPNDRPPFPMPQSGMVPVNFTVQPGGTFIFPKGAQVIYPNYTREAPGTRVEFFAYDPEGKEWHVYGHGRVTADGRQIVPDAKTRVWSMRGANLIAFSETDPPESSRSGDEDEGDPIDLSTGKMYDFKTDLAVAGGLVDLEVTRSYWMGDKEKRAFGIGRDLTYNAFLHSHKPYEEVDLHIPGGKKYHFVRTSPGSSYPDAVFEYRGPEQAWQGTKISYVNLKWKVAFLDGSSWIIPKYAPVQEMRDRYGNAIKLIRLNGDKGPVARIEGPGGRWISLAYDSRERVRQVRDNTGRTVNYTYDDTDRLTTVTDPANKTTRYEYEGASNCVKHITDARGIRYLSNTCRGDMVFGQSAMGRAPITLTYTMSGDKVLSASVSRGDGSSRGATFSNGMPVKTTSNSRETVYERGPYDRLEAVIDPYGRRTEFSYDTKGNMTSVKELVGTADERVLWTKTFDGPFNEVSKVVDGADNTTLFEYDTATGNLVKEVDPEGRETTYTYEPTGQLKTVTDPALRHTTRYTYRHGDLVSVEDPAGRVSSQFSDTAGRLSAITDEVGARATVGFDKMNHVVSTTDPLGQTARFTYDANGNRTSATDVRKNTTRWFFDDKDMIDYVLDPYNNKTDYDYDETFRQASVTSPEGRKATFTYDQDWRPKSIASGTAMGTESTVTYTYNAQDLLEKVTDSQNGVESYTYDAYDRLKTVTGPNGTVEYGHDKADRLVTMKADGVTTTYGYDKSDIMTSVTTGSETVSFGLDAAGRERTATMPGGIVRTTDYDTSGAVRSLSYTKGATSIGDLRYTRDARGQQIRLTGSLAGTALPAATTADATYGADNRITTFGGREFQYNRDGELTNDGLRSYGWNTRGNLTSVTESGQTSTFGYGPAGERVKAAKGGAERKFLTDGANPLLEQNATGQTTARVATSGVDEYLTRTENGKTQVYLTDALGSVVGLANADGTVATRYTYDPYGQSAQSGTASTNPYTFTGREDDGTGLMYYRSRYYHPETGRFISQDPIGAAGGPNLYQYALSSPTTYTDPSGNIPTVLAGCIAGAAWGGAEELAAQYLSGRKVTWGDVGWAALEGCATGALGGVFFKLIGKGISKLSKLRKAKCLANSFTEDTPVLMADGTYKKIEDVKVGDRVLATDPGTGETGAREVTALINGSGKKQLVEITVQSATGKHETLTATKGHPIWLPEQGAWVDAGALKSGQWVQTRNGIRAKIIKIHHHAEVTTVFNLTVDDIPTYYVLAGDTSILVHNCKIDVDAASKSGAKIDPADKRGEYSFAGRALEKHAGRNGNAKGWPIPAGKRNPAGWNKAGQDMLDEILTNPGSTSSPGYGRIGGQWQNTVDIRLPNGMGARFSPSGTFSGFLD